MIYIFDDMDSYSEVQLERDMVELPWQRRQQAEKFSFVEGRKECVLAYRLLCDALRKEFGVERVPEFEYNEHGKPSLAGRPDIGFNLSHCRRAVACIVGRGRVGIDVERIGRFSEALARHVLNDDEYRQVTEAEDRETAFIVFWTRKEALVKYLGTGITDNLKEVLNEYSDVKIKTEIRKDKGYVVSWCGKL